MHHCINTSLHIHIVLAFSTPFRMHNVQQPCTLHSPQALSNVHYTLRINVKCSLKQLRGREISIGGPDFLAQHPAKKGIFNRVRVKIELQKMLYKFDYNTTLYYQYSSSKLVCTFPKYANLSGASLLGALSDRRSLSKSVKHTPKEIKRPPS